MKLFVLLSIMALISTPAPSKPLGKASFAAVGEGLALDIDGQGAVVDGSIVKTGSTISGTFTVNLREFKTGIALRDDHLCKALDCDKFPKAVFVLDKIETLEGEKPFTGKLTLHGVTKAFSGMAKIKGSDVTASGKIQLTDFGITPPEYKLARVSNSVDVRVNLAL